ncbi:GNAT family N-acetyltransferase [Pelagovum pacificum]|uniref:GNAT family N-acetyltransferase n=1 Tax=Pelagovum pacificum TaxID=2588711 RepID=A0A5C5GCZ7_9RHOB|nr:GNAT family protein [Pelagovum pacificum]QQA44516.1 GNAT family N-acetyltransferase [Pelagovum pacificum]TNY32370.1 GNAT family N-acetyltransferase [Pelagovum pacificum]
MFDTDTDLPTIETDRFVLRPVRKSDTGLITFYTSDKRVATMTRNIPHPLPPGAVEAFVTAQTAENRKEDVWIIDGSAKDLAEVLGVVILTRLDRGQSEIRYWIAPAFWNAHFASEAVGALLDANPHGSGEIFAEVFQDNPGSARVLTNCGFDYLGDAEAFSVSRNAMVPTWTYMLKTAR